MVSARSGRMALVLTVPSFAVVFVSIQKERVGWCLGVFAEIRHQSIGVVMCRKPHKY